MTDRSEALIRRADEAMSDLIEIRNNHPGNQLVTVGAGKFQRWADVINDLTALLADLRRTPHRQEQEGDQARMDTTGGSTDSRTAATNEAAQAVLDNPDPRHAALGNLSFLLSVIRCGDQLSPDEEAAVQKTMERLRASMADSQEER